jgi:2-polyprenyl-3-methyl-5-hydroxy-6-metoxy-1,4-benzoquinol methylase
MMDIAGYNRRAWNMQVEKRNVWTLPVDRAVIAEARRGNWKIVLTPNKPVPRDWFPPLAGKRVLCLACGGGQQGPVLAAAGAEVTVLDNSPKQLEQDRLVAERESLSLRTELGDMRDLTRFSDEYFDLIVVTGTCFVDDVTLVWKEAYRILKRSGTLMAGCTNPIEYIFELKAWNAGQLVVRHKIPYSDLVDLSEEERNELIVAKDEPLCVGHSLRDLIQGQIEAGLLLADFYEDKNGGPLDKYIDSSFVTKAVKL